MLAGRLSGGQLDIILANLPRRHLERFAEHEAELVPHLEPLTVEQTAVVMQDWRRHADALDPGPTPKTPDDEVFLSRTLDGRGDLHGNLGPDLTALVETALRVGDPKDFDLCQAQRRAEALGQICQHFLDHQQTRTGGRHRPHLNVSISLDDLADGVGGTYSDTGEPISPIALAMFKCDAAYHRVLFSAASGVLDYGRATRDWPIDLYNAIALETPVAASAAATPHSLGATSIMWCLGRTAATPRSPTGSWLAAATTAWSTPPATRVKLLPDGTVELTHPDGRVDISQPRGPVPQHLWRQPAGS